MAIESEIVADFVLQYKRLQPRSALQYNQSRAAQSPTWRTVALACGLHKWNDLLTYCGLDKPKRAAKVGRAQARTVFVVSREVDVERVLARL